MTTATATTTPATAIQIKATRIIGTTLTVFSAWEPTTRSIHVGRLSHSTITSDDAGVAWLGKVGSRFLPANLDALPAMSQERSDAVRSWHETEYQRAYAAILARHPEAEGGRRDMGEIEVWG